MIEISSAFLFQKTGGKKMKLTRIEQETIILFNEGENEAEVYTHNAKLKKKKKLTFLIPQQLIF